MFFFFWGGGVASFQYVVRFGILNYKAQLNTLGLKPKQFPLGLLTQDVPGRERLPADKATTHRNIKHTESRVPCCFRELFLKLLDHGE